MVPISETDLIFNKDGSIYHLGLKQDHISDVVILVGDPQRVDQVSRYFDTVEWKSSKREFICHVGSLNDRRFTVLSTGIGVDNVEIALTEIDALLNIDPGTFTVKPQTRSISLVRVGTSGAIQKDIPVDGFVVSEYGLGLDNLMGFYDFDHSEEEKRLVEDIIKKVKLPVEPYLVKGSELLINKFTHHMVAGTTITSPGFYAPQARRLRIPIRSVNLLNDIQRYTNNGFRFLNFEMETAALYALARLMGHTAVSVNVILANRATHRFSSNPTMAIDRLIRKVLEIL